MVKFEKRVNMFENDKSADLEFLYNKHTWSVKVSVTCLKTGMCKSVYAFWRTKELTHIYKNSIMWFTNRYVTITSHLINIILDFHLFCIVFIGKYICLDVFGLRKSQVTQAPPQKTNFAKFYFICNFFLCSPIFDGRVKESAAVSVQFGYIYIWHLLCRQMEQSRRHSTFPKMISKETTQFKHQRPPPPKMAIIHTRTHTQTHRHTHEQKQFHTPLNLLKMCHTIKSLRN